MSSQVEISIKKQELSKRKTELEEIIRKTKVEISNIDNEIIEVRSKISSENAKQLSCQSVNIYDTDEDISVRDLKYTNRMNIVSERQVAVEKMGRMDRKFKRRITLIENSIKFDAEINESEIEVEIVPENKKSAVESKIIERDLYSPQLKEIVKNLHVAEHYSLPQLKEIAKNLHVSGYNSMKKHQLVYMINYPTIQVGKGDITKLKKFVSKIDENSRELMVVAEDCFYIKYQNLKMPISEKCYPKDDFHKVKERFFGKDECQKILNAKEFKKAVGDAYKELYLSLSSSLRDTIPGEFDLFTNIILMC